MDIPACSVQEQSPERLVLSFDLEPDMPCFQGHFDGLPVLAGVVQVGWALNLARHHFKRPLNFLGLCSVKFQQLVRPPVHMTLTLELKRRGELLKFKYRNPLGVCSSGGIQLWREGQGD